MPWHDAKATPPPFVLRNLWTAPKLIAYLPFSKLNFKIKLKSIHLHVCLPGFAHFCAHFYASGATYSPVYWQPWHAVPNLQNNEFVPQVLKQVVNLSCLQWNLPQSWTLSKTSLVSYPRMTSKLKIILKLVWNIFLTVIVCCCKLNNIHVCDEHLFGQVSIRTGRYQLPIFRCIFVHQWCYARPYFRQAA